MIKNANPSNLRGSFVQSGKTWRSKSFMSNLSRSASVNYYNKRKSKGWHYRTHNTDLLSPDENKFDYKKNCLWRKSSPKYSNPKDARNGSSRTMNRWSLCKNAENITRQFSSSFSKCSKLQEQMNSLNDSGDFQDVESFYSGTLSHVSSFNDCEFSRFAQPRQKIAAWHMESIWISGTRFWKFNFLRLIRTAIILKEIQSDDVHRNREAGPEAGRTKIVHTKWRRTKSRHISNGDICDKAVGCEFYYTGGITTELRGRTAKIANIGIAIRQIL